ncbi:hypothetical protein D9758_004346 [Tetrapyrgos nigripes]|uniref:Uncharacterized protein n=1 Tax=Tetrapyrgos nigripes TaxID=182062 RepID=A0A8H5GMV6_9AGAR|nr:hypothetical protein D9758_004346 [Tetrapyrgos nigripes]
MLLYVYVFSTSVLLLTPGRPLTAQDLFIRELSPVQRLRYALACKEASRAVKSFNGRAFKISKVLSRYFEPEDIPRFRVMQYNTRMLISGSTALQFFDLTEYSNSDLDLYVRLVSVLIVAQFLQEVGYTFQPINQQISDFNEALQAAIDWQDAHGPHPTGVANQQGDEDWQGYMSNGISEVFNFVKGGKKIQIIACAEAPMEIILRFHSTCVMNVISHSHAYSLFPRATFHDRISVETPFYVTQENKHQAARDKYIQRGWTMVELPSIVDYLRPYSEFRTSSPRCVGDFSCWTITLEPIDLPQTPNDSSMAVDFTPAIPILMGPEADVVRGNMWKVVYESRSRMMMEFSVVTIPGKLKYSYTFWQLSGLTDRVKTAIGGATIDADNVEVDEVQGEQNDMVFAGIVQQSCAQSLKEKENSKGIERDVQNLVHDQLYRKLLQIDVPYTLKPKAPAAERLLPILVNMFSMFKIDPIVYFSFPLTDGYNFHSVAENHLHLRECIWIEITVTLHSSPAFPRAYDSPIRMSTNEGLVRSLRCLKVHLTVKDLPGDKDKHLPKSQYTSWKKGRSVKAAYLYFHPNLASVGVQADSEPEPEVLGSVTMTTSSETD